MDYHQGRTQAPGAAYTVAEPPGPASAPPAREDTEQVKNLKRTRDIIMDAIEALADTEPWKIPQLSKELRETWREISALTKSDDAGETDEFDKFFDDGDDGSSNVLRFAQP